MVDVFSEFKEASGRGLIIPVQIVQAEHVAAEDDEEDANEFEDVGDHASEYDL